MGDKHDKHDSPQHVGSSTDNLLLMDTNSDVLLLIDYEQHSSILYSLNESNYIKGHRNR